MFDHQRDDLGRTRDHFGDFRWCFWAPWQPFAPPYSHEPCLKLHLVRNINVKMRNLQNVYTSYVHGGFSWVLKPYIFKIHHSMFKFGALWMRPFKAPYGGRRHTSVTGSKVLLQFSRSRFRPYQLNS